MRRHAPFDPTDLNICMWGGVADVINCAKFFEHPSKGLGAVRPRKIAFPIEIVHRPYNSVGTTVPNCDETTILWVFSLNLKTNYSGSLVIWRNQNSFYVSCTPKIKMSLRVSLVSRFFSLCCYNRKHSLLSVVESRCCNNF